MKTSIDPLTDSAAPGRRERKRSQTLDLLADTAFRLFEAQGYDQVTMEQIAAEADVAKGTLYNHFPAKEALLAHRFRRELADSGENFRLLLEAPMSFAERMSRLLQGATQWCEERRGYLPHYFRFRFLNNQVTGYTTDNQAQRSGIDRVFEALIRAGQASGEVRQDMSAAHLSSLFQYLYLAALMRWLADPALRLQREFDTVIELFLNGARQAGGKGAA